MSIEIEPAELGFHRPFNVEVSQLLKIRNPNNLPVAFKVKTTAPKQYCVRPNAGRIEPGKDVAIVVLLQSMKQEPPPDAKCRDKFLVQSIALTPDKEALYSGSTWQSTDEADKLAIKEKKIRVIYLPAQQPSIPKFKTASNPYQIDSTTLNSLESDRTSSAHDSTYRSPSPEATFTPEAHAINVQNNSSIGSNQITTPQINVTSSDVFGHEQIDDEASGRDKTVESYVEEGGLRQRKTFKEDLPCETITKLEETIPQISYGVPLQTVAILCFISFLLAYLLF